ncbi:serine/threonine protein kinase [Saprolegnia parasitica CBS 223.65]|uniref:Serine/threonine protein kinase n=1 Tax=Saprolegnia parasitica (strain CBS 223.65) TaxID=695850 RepID=A0A067CXS3_SAPPC|nr:serine/threonine protein kinase [Saprolegnia parasitica CBS 223.65]KDO35283.1 serine/threonine protein kinase [Saprolegnia parasitica CBS 223.65]|eukprot:XP_012193633.1 serine/threonine protein kinase [Saprolegnia parasitica CBS 223.65]
MDISETVVAPKPIDDDAMDTSGDILAVGVYDGKEVHWSDAGNGMLVGTPVEQRIRWEDGVTSIQQQMRGLSCKGAVSLSPPAASVEWRRTFEAATLTMKHALAELGSDIERRQRDVQLEDLYVKRTLSTGDLSNVMFAAYIQSLQDKYAANVSALEVAKAHFRRHEKRVHLHATTAFASLPFLHDRYQLKALIGQGGNSEVWEAYDVHTSTFRAIKICTKLHQAEIEFRHHELFLPSEHTVRVHGPLLMTSHRGAPYSLMVMDRMECDLHQFMENLGGPCEMGLARHLLFQLLLGLDYVHQKGMAHCDLKPANVLLATVAGAQLRLTDFHLSQRKHAIILVGQNASPAFAPPEWYLLSPHEAASLGATYEKFDVWAIGLVFYMLLCHAHPLGTQASKPEMTERMKAYRATPTLHFPAHVPADAQHLIRQCMHLDWHKRPTVQELLAAVCGGL